MCNTPAFIKVLKGPSWVDQQVACGRCWQCRKSRVNDYTGRAMCEASVSQATLALTLTYAPREDGADKRIFSPHFQDFIRALRDRHHLVRYLAVGEYGAKTQRAHFHCILFLNSDAKLLSQLRQEIPQKANAHIDAWPHGHVFGDWSVDERSMRYVCKYLLKEAGREANHWFSLSKKPAIGNDWFQRKAERDADLGVFPASFRYQPPGITSTGWHYTMQGAIRRDYLATLIERMALKDGVPKHQLNEWVVASIEKLEKRQREAEHAALGMEHDVAMLAQKLDLDRISESRARWAAFDERDRAESANPFSYERLLTMRGSAVSSQDYQLQLIKALNEWQANARTKGGKNGANVPQPSPE